MTSLLRRVLGEAAASLPAPVLAVHDRSEAATFSGLGRARASNAPLTRMVRTVVGLPEPGRYPDLAVTIAPDARGEQWTRAFGARRFSSKLVSLGVPGEFEEHVGLVRFRFRIEPARAGFRWRFLGWKVAGLPLPRAWGPRVRAYSYAQDGGYRFRVVTAHPWLGVIFAYGGRLGSANLT